MTVALIIVAALVVVAFAVSPRFAQGLYRKLIFAPEKAHGQYGPCTIRGIEAQDVYFKSGGKRLHGRLFDNPKSDVLILVSHSNAGNVDYWSGLVDHLLLSGASVFIYDYRGYGLSEGEPTIRGACSDGLSAFHYVTSRLGYATDQVVVYGSSLGSGVACEIAHRHRVGGMILHGAFSSLRDVATEILPATRWVPDVFFFRPRMDNCARLRNLDPEIPVLILHGAYDEIFATRHAERLLQASASYDKNLVVLKGCMHMQTDSAHLSAVTALVGELQRLSEGSD